MNDYVKPYQYVIFVFCLLTGMALQSTVLVASFFFLDKIDDYFNFVIFDIENILGTFVSQILFFIIFPFFIIFILSISTRISGICKQQFPAIITSTDKKVDNEYLRPDSVAGSYFYSADDKQLVIRYRDRKTYIIALIVAIIVTAFIGIDGLVDTGDGIYAYWLALSFVFMLYLPYNLFYPAKLVVFDRMTGLVTIPGLFVFPSQKVPFEKVIQGNVFRLQEKIMGIINTFTWTAETIPGRMNSDWWSFYTWYMDKNRPLPHGTLLDPYREQDFKRRQAEGFPAPKYPSLVTITDDRYGYLYATEEFKIHQWSLKMSVLSAYNLVYKEIVKTSQASVKEESIVLVGICKTCYVFRQNIALNQKLELLDLSNISDDCLLVDAKKGKGKVYTYYTHLLNN